MRSYLLAVGMLAMSQVALAAGAFEGDWSGTIRGGKFPSGRNCGSEDMKFTVAGMHLDGKDIYTGGFVAFSADIAPDGTIKGATQYGRPVLGKFSGDTASGTIEGVTCGVQTFEVKKAH